MQGKQGARSVFVLCICPFCEQPTFEGGGELQGKQCEVRVGHTRPTYKQVYAGELAKGKGRVREDMANGQYSCWGLAFTTLPTLDSHGQDRRFPPAHRSC